MLECRSRVDEHGGQKGLVTTANCDGFSSDDVYKLWIDGTIPKSV